MSGFSTILEPVSANNLLRMKEGLDLYIEPPFDKSYWECYEDRPQYDPNPKGRKLVETKAVDTEKAPLVIATAANDKTEVEKLLKKNPSYEVMSHAVLKACQTKSLPLLQLLVAHGADVNGTDGLASPLTFASDNEELCAYLLHHGATVGVENALHDSIARGLTPEMARLLAPFANSISKKKQDMFPMEHLVKAGNLEATQIFMDAGVLPYTSANMSLLAMAADCGHLELAKFLLARQTKDSWAIGTQYESSVACAARKGHFDIVQMLVEGGESVHDVAYPSLPLYEAAKAGRLDIVKYLVSKGAVDAVSTHYRAPKPNILAIAVAKLNKHTDVVNFLASLPKK